MSDLSSFYIQLGQVFQVLEVARFVPDLDFGANPVKAYQWYISPSAVKFLNKRNTPEWLFLKYNSQINFNLEIWTGSSDKGATFQLKLANVPACI